MTAVLEGNVPSVTLTAHLGLNASRQRVHHRNTDTVQTTGDSVTAAAELTTGVQNRHNDLNGGLMLRGVLVNGNTAAVIFDAYRAVLLDYNINAIRVTGERLVNRVINDLVNQVVQTALSS